MTTVDQLAAQVHRQALDTAVRRCAPDLGVDPEVLLDSRAFVTAAQGLDPGSPGFARDVRAAAQGAVTGNPGRFVPAPAPLSSPPPAPAADPAGPPQWTMEDVNRASPAEMYEAMNTGKLRALGVAPGKQHRR